MSLIPFLKWAGGKRWLVSRHKDLFPVHYNVYFEPFLGAGSVYFYLNPKQAVLADINEELILTYIAIRDNWRELEELLALHQENHNKDYYYFIRGESPINQIERAARFIYLNRTCFNGIYRVNLKGKFNVPIGTKDKVILETDNFREASELLSRAQLHTSDFEQVIDASSTNDFVFADPPYTVRHNQNGFIKYNENLFSWNDQVRLADSLWRAKNRGVKILSTNANHQSVRELYEERGFNVHSISRYSSISASAEKRNQYEEIIVNANI
ncbi:DNA adenine methylase [Priestia megaterium]|uniref:DNA adenine methylase n=1 Tax=Priestia megaterium TaxID=1404 RepID=UPI00211E090D|nr:Dam family site-specific DNA-(adenine-N6)-methyltransferase [Priestia megaterium]